MSLRNDTAWIREVQALSDGTSVEQGLLIQKWAPGEDHVALRQDGRLRKRLHEQLVEADALDVKEITWQFGLTEAEEAAMYAGDSPSEEHEYDELDFAVRVS